MRTWLPSQVYRDEAEAASVLAFLVCRYDTPADPRKAPYVLGVQLRSSGELIGHVGFSPLDDAVEIGFAIAAGQQRKGFATDAVRAACEWAARAFALPRLLGVTAAGNAASQRVLLRAGFARVHARTMRFQGMDQPVVLFGFAAEGRGPRAVSSSPGVRGA